MDTFFFQTLLSYSLNMNFIRQRSAVTTWTFQSSCPCVLSEDFVSQRGPTQGAAAEVLSWQVSPSGQRIEANQVATTFTVPCHHGFDVWGLGGVWIWYLWV